MADNIGASGRLLAVTDEQLQRISPCPVPPGTAQEINDVVADAKIVSHLELAHFIAQCCYESAYFHHYEEQNLVPGQYEGNIRLGNVQAGDGAKFKGRGAIQLTGRRNYRAFNDWLRAKEEARDIDMFTAPLDVTDTPATVANQPYRWLAAAWFWATHSGLRIAAQADDVPGVTRIITGAAVPGEKQGLSVRIHLTDRAIEVLG